MTSILFYILLAMLAGLCVPAQAGINAQLNGWTRSPVLAAAISFAVGTVALFGYALLSRIPLPPFASLTGYPWWIWLGGLLGAFFVAITLVLVSKLGATAMLALVVAGQMLASLFLDHFGLLGYQMHPINLWRVTGVFFVVGGVILVWYF